MADEESGAAASESALAGGRATIESWRADVLRGMLMVAAVASPVVAIVALALPSVPYPWSKILLFVAGGICFPVLRFVPGLSVTLRASVAIVLAFGTAVIALTTSGFSAGPGVVLVATSIFAVIFLGRLRALLFIALSVAAFFVVGELATRGMLSIPAVELDPQRMRNWTRIGIVFAVLSCLLTSAIGFVIRQVEASSRATAAALGELRLAHRRLGQLHGRLEDAKEEERRVIAHELHDELGQVLTALKLRLQLDPGTRHGVPDPLRLIDQVIGQVRTLSGALRPPLLDEVGLVPAIRAYLVSQEAVSGVVMYLEADQPTADGAERQPDFEIACFRVVQESVTNALRHASARGVRVRMVREGHLMSLSIQDDGRGFDTSMLDRAAAAGHLGVVGMRERVRARGGSFRLTSLPGAGTTVAIELPIVDSGPIPDMRGST
jgi:signal transduction histidine kinase